VEAYILTGICLFAFVGTVGISRLLIRDWEHYGIFGLILGLMMCIVAGGGYFAYLARCTACG